MHVIALISSKTMVNAFRKNNEISFNSLNSNPLVIEISHIEESTSSHDISDFFIDMDVLLAKFRKHFLIIIALSTTFDDISGGILSFKTDSLEFIIFFFSIELPMFNAELLQLLRSYPLIIIILKAFANISVLADLRFINIPSLQNS